MNYLAWSPQAYYIKAMESYKKYPSESFVICIFITTNIAFNMAYITHTNSKYFNHMLNHRNFTALNYLSNISYQAT